jgi:hypothetical protein
VKACDLLYRMDDMCTGKPGQGRYRSIAMSRRRADYDKAVILGSSSAHLPGDTCNRHFGFRFSVLYISKKVT